MLRKFFSRKKKTTGRSDRFFLTYKFCPASPSRIQPGKTHFLVNLFRFNPHPVERPPYED